MLVEQYNLQFSRNRNVNKATEEEIQDVNEGDLIDINFNKDDIINAINKLNKNSAAGPDGIPSVLLNTKDVIMIPH